MTYHQNLSSKWLDNQSQNKLKIDFVNNNL
jgi:hypothetical protein